MTAASLDGSSSSEMTHSNPMFDYENLDDIHAEELTTPRCTPEPGSGPPILDVGKMFEIKISSNHVQSSG